MKNQEEKISGSQNGPSWQFLVMEFRSWRTLKGNGKGRGKILKFKLNLKRVRTLSGGADEAAACQFSHFRSYFHLSTFQGIVKSSEGIPVDPISM